jgi:glycosyltransferase involved in cell wall biosynthesis
MVKKPALYWLHTHFLLATGATRFILEVLTILAAHWDVTVLVEQASPEWTNKFEQAGIKVQVINSLSSQSLWYWLFFPYYFWLDCRQLRQLIPNNAMIVSSMFPMPVLATFLSKKTLYYCFEPFAFFYDRSVQQSFTWLKQWLLMGLTALYRPWDAYGVRHQRLLMSINPAVGRSVQAIYHVVPSAYSFLGVDVNFFSPAPTDQEKRPFTIVHSTDYTPLKGTWFLLRALPLVAAKIPQMQLIISESVSNALEKTRMVQFLSDQGLANQVVWIGHVPYSKLAELYRSANIYCFVGDPTSTGATAASLSVLEAAACGLPVIRSVGNDDEVIAGKTGLLVDPRQSADLAAAIISLAENPALRKTMGRAARQHVVQNYTWPKVAAQIQKQLDILYTQNTGE